MPAKRKRRVCATPFRLMFVASQFARLDEVASPALQPFVTAAGRVRFDLPALVLQAQRAP